MVLGQKVANRGLIIHLYRIGVIQQWMLEFHLWMVKRVIGFGK
jgi:hypothetical protein